ncbi:serine hydroxymethyltransferase [Streptomyces violaceorubidus]
MSVTHDIIEADDSSLGVLLRQDPGLARSCSPKAAGRRRPSS